MFIDLNTIKEEIEKEFSHTLDELLLDYEFVIWNSTLGLRDLATIDSIKKEHDNIHIYLDEPYDIIGPICVEKLCDKGKVSFEACQIITHEIWDRTKHILLQESFLKQQQIHEEFQRDVRRFNRKNNHQEREYRELLKLPLHGDLKITQIKTAYKNLAKMQHPDVGGTHEKFVLLGEAKEALLSSFKTL